MKSKLSYQCQAATQGLLLALALFGSGLASAQNFVKNPDFEETLGPDNWTVVYVNCDPGDFLIADRSTMAHKDLVPGVWDGHPGFTGSNYWSRLGGHFAPNYCNAMPQAYLKQVVTGLTPGDLYTVSAWMVQFTRNDRWLALAQVYMEALGGPTGTQSKITQYVTANANNNPAGWQRYVINNVIASTSGQIEIRLHYKVIATTAQIWEYRNMNAYYDHVAVMPAGQTEYTPPYGIDSFALTNQTATIEWGTVSNHIYGVETSSDLTNWVYSRLFLIGTGSDMTVTNNASVDAQYFRVHRVWPHP